MSAGAFVRSRYEAQYDGASIHPIRIQPETALAAVGATTNAAVTGALTNPISAQVTGSKRSLGLHARKLTIQLTGTPPTGYLAGSVVSIPCLTETFYLAASLKGTVVNYLGTTWETVSVSPERTN